MRYPMKTIKTLQTIGSALILTSMLMGCSMFNHSVAPTPSPPPQVNIDTTSGALGPIVDNYIRYYIKPNQILLRDSIFENQLYIMLFFKGREIHPEFDRTEFLELAKARNDFGFNQPVNFGFSEALTKTVNNLTIAVTPSWVAPDSTQNLDDLVKVRFYSAQEFMANGFRWNNLEHLYTTSVDDIDGQMGTDWGQRRLSIAEFNTQDSLHRSILQAAFHLIFTTPPHQPGDYTFTVTINLGEGEGDDIETFTTSIGPIRVELE
jgi:hypothetical protein